VLTYEGFVLVVDATGGVASVQTALRPEVASLDHVDISADGSFLLVGCKLIELTRGQITSVTIVDTDANVSCHMNPAATHVSHVSQTASTASTSLTHTYRVTDRTGTVTYLSEEGMDTESFLWFEWRVLMSPGGKFFSIQDGAYMWTPSLRIYDALGVLQAKVPGYALGWLDDGHLVANVSQMPLTEAIYAPDGSMLGTPPPLYGYPAGPPFTPLSPSTVTMTLPTGAGIVWDVPTGATLWQTPGVGNPIVPAQGMLLYSDGGTLRAVSAP
jgi:hypothetical protein